MGISTVIFDLDGVLVDTNPLHLEAWEKLALTLNIKLNEEIKSKLRGLGRSEALELILREKNDNSINYLDKKKLTDQKNIYYLQYIKKLTVSDLLPGAMKTLKSLRKNGYKIALGSSSANAPLIIERLNIKNFFNYIVDLNQLDHLKPKPEPDIFLNISESLKVPPNNCLIIEDSIYGVEAANKAKMHVLAIGQTSQFKNKNVVRVIENLNQWDYKELEKKWISII